MWKIYLLFRIFSHGIFAKSSCFHIYYNPTPRFPIFFFKNLASGLNLNRPETPVETRADSGAPPLYFSGGGCVGLGPLS